MAERTPAERPKLLHFADSLPDRNQFGERLRLRIVAGNNIGHGYCLLADRIVIGRDDSCDLVIEDEKSSRKHVELLWKKDRYFARDLDSANGILLNQKKVKASFLEAGDLMIVGDTGFEIIAVGKQSQLGLAIKPALKNAKQDTDRDKLKKKRVTVFAVFLLLAMIAFSSSEKVLTFREKGFMSFVDQEKPERILTKKEGKEAINDFVPTTESEAPGFKQAQLFYREGMRELAGGNYRRAISAFETAQTVDPTHELSRVYIEIAKQRLAAEVDFNYRAAVGAIRAHRVREAKMYYATVLRLLEKDPNNVLFTESKNAIEKIEKYENRNQK